MNRSKIVTGILAFAAMSSCQSSKVRISGRLVGSDVRTVYIEEVSPRGDSTLPVDSVVLDDKGNYSFELKKIPSTPTLYNLSYDGESIPLLIEAGDRLTINSAGSLARNYTVEGNEESMLLREFNLAYVESAERLNDIAAEYARCESEEELERLARSYSRAYLRIKQDQVEFIVKNKSSVAAVYALSQRLPGDRYLFNGSGDAIYYRTVADALEERYPESPYLASLRSEIAQLDAMQTLSAEIVESGFPDLEISNMYGKKVRLSSLKGAVVLVDFWSPSLGNSNALNADLKELYDKYHDRGFEVYQVAIETSKPVWINTVQEQRLPWISVCDLRGESSLALTLYNIRKLPANYLIDRKGDIVAKDLYGTSLEEQLDKLL